MYNRHSRPPIGHSGHRVRMAERWSSGVRVATVSVALLVENDSLPLVTIVVLDYLILVVSACANVLLQLCSIEFEFCFWVIQLHQAPITIILVR